MIALGILYGLLGLSMWVGFAILMVTELGYSIDDGEDAFVTLGLAFLAGILWPLTLLVGGVVLLVMWGVDFVESKSKSRK